VRVSKGAGFGIGETLVARKNASWRALIAKIEAGPGTSSGSVRARLEATVMTAPMPALVILLERAKNSSALVMGKMYWQGSEVSLPK